MILPMRDGLLLVKSLVGMSSAFLQPQFACSSTAVKMQDGIQLCVKVQRDDDLFIRLSFSLWTYVVT